MAAAAGLQLGKNAKAYYRSSGSWGTPTYTEITNVHDLDYGMSDAEAESTTRGSGGLKTFNKTLREWAPSWTMLEDASDTTFLYIIAAAAANTVVEVFFSGGTKTDSGHNYLHFDCQFRVEKTEPIEGINAWKVTAKPTYSSNVGVWGVTA